MSAYSLYMLASTLRRLDEHGRDHDRVYAIEQPANGREFKIMTAEDAWHETQRAQSAHFYEVLTGPCNLYLDIEWYESAQPSKVCEEHRVHHIVQHVIACVKAVYGVQQTTVTRATASGMCKGKYKCSWHVHVACDKVCWANSLAVGQFVRKHCATLAEVDKLPYAGHGQNWRCVGSSKRADPSRVFLPKDHATFVGCTVQQPVAGRELVHADAVIPKQLQVPVPPHIYRLAASLNTGGTPVMTAANRCVVPFRERQVCEHVNRKHHSNHQYAVINTSTLMWKMNCHSCVHAISVWRTFPCFTNVKDAFTCQYSQYTPNAPLPATRFVSATPVRIDMHSHGPPPLSLCDSGPVLCADGVYACNA